MAYVGSGATAGTAVGGGEIRGGDGQQFRREQPLGKAAGKEAGPGGWLHCAGTQKLRAVQGPFSLPRCPFRFRRKQKGRDGTHHKL